MDTTKVTFDGVRQNIVEYLSSNPTFKDYNFTAPAISTLIDALAYTSHYLIRYANFSLNECFLDTAQLRKNVVSHAKELGYIPHQYTAAKVKLRVSLTPGLQIDDGTKIPSNTIFLASSSNKTYTFRTLEPFVFVKNDVGVWYADVEAVEGTFVTESFIQDEYYTTRYILINENIDTSYLKVLVFKSESDMIGDEFSPVTDITSFGNDSKIYFLQENYDGKMEIYFGDGKLSEKLNPYSIIKVSYLVTNGSNANNIVNFTLANKIGDIGINQTTITCLSPSEQGADKESIESIRLNAPKYYQAQDRAVVTSDYNALLTNKFGGWIDSVVTWGGEDNIPPQYSKVCVCVKPKFTDTLSPSQKNSIVEYLESRNMPCIDVDLINPQYINVELALTIEWWTYRTSKNKSDIETLIENTVREFFKVNINTFTSRFRYSKFLTALNGLDDSIDSILTDIRLKQYIKADSSMSTSYVVEFLNKIEPSSVLIGPWKESENKTYSISDINGDGILRLTEASNGKSKIIGNVDYDNGIVYINNIKFGSNVNPVEIPVVCSPQAQNINLAKNYLLKLTNLNININENS